MKRLKPKTKKYLVIAAITLVALILLGLLSGYLQYYYAYVRCGAKPVMVEPASIFSPDQKTPAGYYLPEDGSSYSPSVYKYYYCTVQEAEANRVKPHQFSLEGQRRSELDYQRLLEKQKQEKAMAN